MRVVKEAYRYLSGELSRLVLEMSCLEMHLLTAKPACTTNWLPQVVRPGFGDTEMFQSFSLRHKNVAIYLM